MTDDRARELREALETVRDGSGTTKLWPARQVVENAARTIALPILERDGRLVEKIYSAIAARVPSPEVSRSMLWEILAALETEES